MSDTIGFIGLGELGLPVATNLLTAGYALRVYNRTARKADPLLALGAHPAVRPVDVVTPGGIVVTLVWDDAALESVVASEGFLESLGPDGVHLSMNTVLPETAREIAAGAPSFSQSAIPLKDVGLFKTTAHHVDVPTPLSDRLYDLLHDDAAHLDIKPA